MGGREEGDYVRRKTLHCVCVCVCVCVFPYLCLAKGNSIIPVFGFGVFGLSKVWAAVQCVVACRLHICYPVQGPQGISIPSCGCLGPPDPARLF